MQADIDAGNNLLDRFYYNNAFNKVEMDRMVSILSEVDVADMPLPKLENHLYFLNPKTELTEHLITKADSGNNPDLNYLEDYYINKPEGTSDNDETRKVNADLFLSAMKRKLYFEGNDEYLKSNFQLAIIHSCIDILKLSLNFSQLVETNKMICETIWFGNFKSEKIYNDEVGRENVCISSNSLKSTTKAFYGFTAVDFEVVHLMLEIKPTTLNIFSDHIIFRHIDKPHP